MSDDTLVCGCGHTFEDALGAYGCPNCEGFEGPAVPLIPMETGRYLGVEIIERTPHSLTSVRWLSRDEFRQLYPPKDIGVDLAVGPDRTVLCNMQAARVIDQVEPYRIKRPPLFTDRDVQAMARVFMRKVFEREFEKALTDTAGAQVTKWTFEPDQLPRLTVTAMAIKDLYQPPKDLK